MLGNGIVACWVSSEEYIQIDINQLDTLPKITSTYEWWNDLEEFVEYHTTSNIKKLPDGKFELKIFYEASANPHLKKHQDIPWGESTFIIDPKANSGNVSWKGSNTDAYDGTVKWNLVSTGLFKQKERESVSRLKRNQAKFKAALLTCEKACVISKETSLEALEAAHIIPSKLGGAEVIGNGILLRADLHRLFDAGRFRIGSDGKIVVNEENKALLSAYYIQILENAQIPQATQIRIANALSYIYKQVK